MQDPKKMVHGYCCKMEHMAHCAKQAQSRYKIKIKYQTNNLEDTQVPKTLNGFSAVKST